MDQVRLRSIILNIQDRLSKDDRIRLHFYLGDDVPRRIQDDPSLAETLNLIDSLFDQDKINHEKCSYLINAFEDIHCVDAAKLLREHLDRNRRDGLDQSIQSLTLIMPHMLTQALLDQEKEKEEEEEEEEDRQAVPFRSTEQETIYGSNNITINRNNIIIKQNSIPIIVNNRRQSVSNPRKKQLLWKYLLLFILLSAVTHVVVISFCLWDHITILFLKRNYGELMEMLQQMTTNHIKTIPIMAQLLNTETKNTTAILSILIPTIPSNTHWKPNGVTIAGGHGRGNATNQFYSPRGLFVDDDLTVVISDNGNNRIMEWKMGDTNGKVVAGGSGHGNKLGQLNKETHVLFDKQTNSLIICDLKNRRVLRKSRLSNTTEEEILLDNIDCLGLAMDDQRRLYISDIETREVRRYQMGDKMGTLVAGGHGPGSDLNQILSPYFIFVDQQHNVYVADNGNHRVMKWNKDAKEGVVVAGGQGRGSALTQFDHPNGLFVDTRGTLYVADDLNYRVMRWKKGAKQGTIIAGGNGPGQGANQFNGAADLFLDRHGQLYVVDEHNHRVQRFDIEQTT